MKSLYFVPAICLLLSSSSIMGLNDNGSQKIETGKQGHDVVCNNAIYSLAINFPCNVSSENIFDSYITENNTVPSTLLFTSAPIYFQINKPV